MSYPPANNMTMRQVYRPGQPVQTLNINDSLSGDEILPGFTLALKDVFGE
ncbi:MAG: hypothetical protein BroJett018_54260 [Chloroflexota bacterium]|nr:MAG: hypothetical protein BroJett018_54260 [Chloroflexota bacterium]